jgi:putative ABC transport system substrate-binding protein
MSIVVKIFSLLIVALLMLPPGVSAQPSSKIYKVGWVTIFPPPTKLPLAFEMMKTRLAERGYVEGKNVTFEARWANADYSKIPQFVAELERSGVDVLSAPGSRNARMTQELAKKTPVVFLSCDPFDHVSRLARQGGNVTGATCMTSEMTGKRLELLKEAIPTVSRVVFFAELEDSPSGLRRAHEAAPQLGMKLWPIGFKSRADMPRALEAAGKERSDALSCTLPDRDHGERADCSICTEAAAPLDVRLSVFCGCRWSHVIRRQ